MIPHEHLTRIVHLDPYSTPRNGSTAWRFSSCPTCGSLFHFWERIAVQLPPLPCSSTLQCRTARAHVWSANRGLGYTTSCEYPTTTDALETLVFNTFCRQNAGVASPYSQKGNVTSEYYHLSLHLHLSIVQLQYSVSLFVLVVPPKRTLEICRCTTSM